MTEDEFVEYIFSNLRAKDIKPLFWYEEFCGVSGIGNLYVVWVEEMERRSY